MAYGATEDVESFFKSIDFSATTAAVDEDEVEDFIDRASARIDSKIAKKYVVPVTGTESVKVLTDLVVRTVAATVIRILNSTVGVSENELNRAAALEKSARDDLADIVSGKSLLPDATLASATALDPFSYNLTNDQQPVFEKEVDQW